MSADANHTTPVTPEAPPLDPLSKENDSKMDDSQFDVIYDCKTDSNNHVWSVAGVNVELTHDSTFFIKESVKKGGSLYKHQSV